MRAILSTSEWILPLLIAVTLGEILGASPPSVLASEATEFSGTVLLVDTPTSKLALKKDGSGTRFTFVANDTTQFEGGLKSLHDVKKDSLTVQYRVLGSQYIALKVTPRK